MYVVMRPKSTSGFTLFELLVAMMVVGIILGFGVPNLIDIVRSNRMTTAANDMLAAMHVARTEAVKSRVPVSVCASADPMVAVPTCGGGPMTGWVVFLDNNDGDADGLADGDIIIQPGEQVLQRHAVLDATLSVSSDGAYASYAGSGFSRAFAGAGPALTAVLVCDMRGNRDLGGGISAARVMQLAATGRGQVLRTTADVANALALPGFTCP